MKNLTLRNLTEVCSGTWHGDDALRDREISAITTDSRKIEKDCLFVPIVGERVDAHRFIPDGMTKGALATLSERELPEADYAYIQVEASLQAVKDILSGTAADSGCRYYGKRWKDQHQRSDRIRPERKVPHSENTGKL